MPMNELFHHGIKGMRWGVRRYQNPDGTLTEAGKRRERAIADRNARREVRNQRKWNKKNVSLLSDDELNSQITRLQKENQLKQLSADAVTPGRKKAANMLDRYGNQLLATVVGGVATGVAMRYVNARMDVRLAKSGYKVKGYNKDGTANYGDGGLRDDN